MEQEAARLFGFTAAYVAQLRASERSLVEQVLQLPGEGVAKHALRLLFYGLVRTLHLFQQYLAQEVKQGKLTTAPTTGVRGTNKCAKALWEVPAAIYS